MSVPMELTPKYPLFLGEHLGEKFAIELTERKHFCEKTKEVRYNINYGYGHNPKYLRYGISALYNYRGWWPHSVKIGGFKFTQKEMIEQAYLHMIEEINLLYTKKDTHEKVFKELAIEIAPLKVIIEKVDL